MAGVYRLAVFFDSQPIFNSPTIFQVSPAEPWVPSFTSIFPSVSDCNPSKGCVSLKMIATAGKETSFIIESRDFWGNRRNAPEQVDLKLTASMLDPSVNGSFAGSVGGPVDGLYTASFTPTLSGIYAVQVFLSSPEVLSASGAPYLYNVKPSSIWPSLCFVVGDTRFKGVAGVAVTFTIQVK